MSIERTASLTDGQQREVRALARAVAVEAGSPPLNDESLIRLAEERPGLAHISLRTAGTLVGYAQLDGHAAELATGEEQAGELLDAVEAAAPRLVLWTHGERSMLAPLLEQRGYQPGRLLYQLRRPMDHPLPETTVPAGVTVRPFAVGIDEDAWLRVNAAAFAHHAEQGGWARADLAGRESEPWFDPAGFLLASKAGRLLGFHWTKVHPDGAGEVYVLGVDPAAQGLRLGAALLAAGLRHLMSRGCPYVLLYVDATNTTAIRLYERFGFARFDVDAQWVRP